MTIRSVSAFTNNVQEIHVSNKGIIMQTSNEIFDLNDGDNIFNLHPFFESLKSEFSSDIHSDLAFPCVQIHINDTEAICDITIRMERDFIAILLFDYSAHYEHLHEAAQEKKTAMLNEQAHELTTKYSEERKVFLDYLLEHIENKIVHNLREIESEIRSLENLNLSKKQSSTVNNIKESIKKLHLNALQIKEGLEEDLN